MNKKRRRMETVVFLLFRRLLDHFQKRFVFLAAFGADVQMFADERHEDRCIVLIYLPLYIFIQFGVDFIAGQFLGAYILKYAQESKNSLVGHFLFHAEAGADPVDKVFNVHRLRFLMFNIRLILLLLKEGEDFVRGDILP